MPTGYTAAVEDGTITDLPTFALRCARAFGALIMMREEPADAPIPEDPPFEPSSYHTDSLARAEKRLLALLEMTAGQVEAECDAVYKRRVQEAAEDVAQLKVKNDRYRAMRQKVEAWTPPSSEHEGLKRFMLEQLRLHLHPDAAGTHTACCVACYGNRVRRARHPVPSGSN